MTRSAAPIWIAIAVVLAALYGGWKVWQVQSTQQRSPVQSGQLTFGPSEGRQVTPFELTRSDGTTFSPDDLAGEVWVASFFFTTCPGTCTKLNTNIQMLQTDEVLTDVKWVSISVDPVNDTLEALTDYAQRFQADPDRWYFTRGPLKEVRRIGQQVFRLPVGFQGHNDYGVVIDRGGEIRGVLNINSHRDRDKLKTLLADLLREEAATVRNDPL